MGMVDKEATINTEAVSNLRKTGMVVAMAKVRVVTRTVGEAQAMDTTVDRIKAEEMIIEVPAMAEDTMVRMADMVVGADMFFVAVECHRL
jgi:hypothetical protein